MKEASSYCKFLPDGIANWPTLERVSFDYKRSTTARSIILDVNNRIAPGNTDHVLNAVRRPSPHSILLGRWRSEPVILEISEEANDQWPDGREWMMQLPQYMFPLLSTAMQIATWRRDHCFCGRCGSATHMHSNEMAMVCHRCRHRSYPRISPCIITLVTYGRELLLARSPRFKPGRFSTLAGFIEAGESAEEAVRREVMEEVGVEVGHVRYFTSQSWPFPHSFMLAYYAEALTRDIRIDGIEIEAADWFQPEQLPALPGPEAVSWALIDNFVKSVAIR